LGRLYTYKASADLITLGQIPGALKGYPYCMQQAIKATALVLLVSLLSGCSSSPKPADKPQAKTECEIVVEKATEKANLLKELQAAKKDNNNRALLSWLYYIVEESNCFSSEIVSEAKAGIAVILKQ